MGVRLSSTGRLLGSVALRYSHPLATGVRWLRSLGGKGRFYLPFGRDSLHDGGGGRRDDQLARLEAVFFLSQQPQTSRRLAQLAGLADGTKARTLVRALNHRYDTGESAFRVEEVAGGFQLMTRSKFAPWLRRLHSAQSEVRLSAPAMEALAVVAYRQPVLRTEIEAVRGVQSGEVLRQLVERELVRIVGRSDELGRPFLYGTTKQFLQVFGLRHLDELPRAEVLRVRQPPPTPEQEIQIGSDTDTSNQSNQFQAVEEETNVKTLITAQPRRDALAEDRNAVVTPARHDDRPGNKDVFDKYDEDDDIGDDEDEESDAEEDYEDEFEDEEEEEEEEEDEDLEDEPWEEVDDEDEELDDDEEDEDWDEDEDWEDEDWDDDEDDDWDEDEEEEPKEE
jgi:segregation and condensation protein B